MLKGSNSKIKTDCYIHLNNESFKPANDIFIRFAAFGAGDTTSLKIMRKELSGDDDEDDIEFAEDEDKRKKDDEACYIEN